MPGTRAHTTAFPELIFQAKHSSVQEVNSGNDKLKGAVRRLVIEQISKKHLMTAGREGLYNDRGKRRFIYVRLLCFINKVLGEFERWPSLFFFA